MILSITSDLPTFKPLEFHAGLNVLVADRKEQSSDGHTRNSAGKTCAVEILHFLLGADAKKGTLCVVPELAEVFFRGRLQLGTHEIEVARKGSDANRIIISPSDAENIGVELTRDAKTGVRYLPLKRWKEALGHYWFGLPLDPKGTAHGEAFSPGLRSLIGYFARRNAFGGFTTPEKHGDGQAAYDYQVNLSYLIGLDWQVPRSIEGLRVGEATLRGLRKAIKDGALGQVFGSVAEIRPEIARNEERMARLRKRIEAFEVLDDYREYVASAAQAKGRMQEIARRLVQERQGLAHLERVITEERPPEFAAIERLYSTAGVELPDVALRRFDDVAVFHQSVVANRRQHLKAQIDETQLRITAYEAELAERDAFQADTLRKLVGKGALEDHMRMAEELASLEGEATVLREKLKNAEILEGKKTQFQLERAVLHQKLQEDHQAHSDALRAAILKVDHAISNLYDDRKGDFIVDATPKGPEFSITIQGDGNRGGIDHMEIFCFDLMLYETVAERFEGGPGFLVHDSHLFDGVDERQMRAAITLGTAVANAARGQYIVALNSDMLAHIGQDVIPEKAILRTKLSDDEGGGLFGIRFTQGKPPRRR